MVTSRPELLTELTDDALARACEVNPSEWKRLWGVLPDQELHDDPDVTWIASPNRGRVNAISVARFTARSADTRIATIIARYRALERRAWWWVGPASTPADLPARLRSAGLRCLFKLHGMAAALGRIPAAPLPRGVRVFEVDDFSVFDVHPHPSISGSWKGDQRPRIDALAVLTAHEPRRVWHLAAFLGRVPVGTLLVVDGAGVAGIYDVGVLPEFRRRGIGAALTRAGMTLARRLGFRAAILQTTGARRLYERIGFRKVCAIDAFCYSKSQQARERLTRKANDTSYSR